MRASPPQEEQTGPFAYYWPPATDGSRPGVYYVNTSAPETRARFDVVVDACHEAVPGHHLQIAVARRLTGLPALGWSRQDAIDHLVAHTAVPAPQAAREVDRYLAWPGQALSYKLGQREIRALREEAAERQGPAFDVRRFHDVVLGSGALPLVTLRELVETELRRPEQTPPAA